MSDELDRRSFLAALGTSTLALGTGAASADEGGGERREPRDRPPGTSGVDGNGDLPVFAAGTSKHKYRADGDAYVHEHRFKSEALEERYGDPVVAFEPERIPKRMVGDEVKDRGTTTFKFEDRLVVGTPNQHAQAEQQILEKRRSGDGVSVQTHLTDDLPLYHYKNAADAQNQQSRKAPINVGWADASSATWVKNFLEGDCGWTQYDWLPEEPRYVNDGGTVRSTDEHVMDRIYVTRQWHVRLYEVDHDRYTVVGQAHRDPLNHNQGITIDDWHFDDSKAQIVDDWTNNSSRHPYYANLASGAGFESHDGYAALLRVQ